MYGGIEVMPSLSCPPNKGSRSPFKDRERRPKERNERWASIVRNGGVRHFILQWPCFGTAPELTIVSRKSNSGPPELGTQNTELSAALSLISYINQSRCGFRKEFKQSKAENQSNTNTEQEAAYQPANELLRIKAKWAFSTGTQLPSS